MKEKIIDVLKKVVSELTDEAVEITLSVPEMSSHGDYSSNLALILAKKLNKSPREIATQIQEKITLDIVEKVEIAGPGFINFFLSQDALAKTLKDITSEKDLYGTSKKNKGKEVVVEYSSPNIAKPFTVGHLRSTIIGDAIANLLEATGWKVYRDNHVGDWGTQFGKLIAAIKEWPDDFEKIHTAENPVKILVELYVKFHDEAENNSELEEKGRMWFKKLEDGDTEARNLWEQCITWSWNEFTKIYKKLGIDLTKFENDGMGYGESFFEDKMEPILAELEKHKLLTEDKGAKLVYFPDDKYPPLMIMKQDGATLYATRDLATDKFRLSHYGENIKIINEVGIEQSLYFKQLYELEKMLGWFKEDQRIHVGHGHYRFKEGKMSTRKGNVIRLDDVINFGKEKAKSLALDKSTFIDSNEIIIKQTKIGNSDEKTINAITIGALKWNDLKRNYIQDITFDWDDILNMNGNSGPYLQYTYARTQSILSKSSHSGVESTTIESSISLEPEESGLLRKLIHFPDVVTEAADRLAPSTICTYLFELAQDFNLFYQKIQILKSEEKARKFRLSLTSATGQVIKNGLSLLGIESPEKM